MARPLGFVRRPLFLRASRILSIRTWLGRGDGAMSACGTFFHAFYWSRWRRSLNSNAAVGRLLLRESFFFGVLKETHQLDGFNKGSFHFSFPASLAPIAPDTWACAVALYEISRACCWRVPGRRHAAEVWGEGRSFLTFLTPCMGKKYKFSTEGCLYFWRFAQATAKGANVLAQRCFPGLLAILEGKHPNDSFSSGGKSHEAPVLLVLEIRSSYAGPLFHGRDQTGYVMTTSLRDKLILRCAWVA